MDPLKGIEEMMARKAELARDRGDQVYLYLLAAAQEAQNAKEFTLASLLHTIMGFREAKIRPAVSLLAVAGLEIQEKITHAARLAELEAL